MKIGELRKTISKYDKENLSYIIAEMYKVLPKTLKQQRGIDELILFGKQQKDKPKKSKPAIKVDLGSLCMEIEDFCENAYEQLYFAPNRVINKKRRSQWRFVVINFYKELMIAADQKQDLEATGLMLVELYKVLTYGVFYHTFATTDTFGAIKVPQVEFLKAVLSVTRQYQNDDAFVLDAIKLVYENGSSNDILTPDLLAAIIGFLDTPDMYDKALNACNSIIKKLKAERVGSKDKYTIEININLLEDFRLVLER